MKAKLSTTKPAQDTDPVIADHTSTVSTVELDSLTVDTPEAPTGAKSEPIVLPRSKVEPASKTKVVGRQTITVRLPTGQVNLVEGKTTYVPIEMVEDLRRSQVIY